MPRNNKQRKTHNNWLTNSAVQKNKKSFFIYFRHYLPAIILHQTTKTAVWCFSFLCHKGTHPSIYNTAHTYKHV